MKGLLAILAAAALLVGCEQPKEHSSRRVTMTVESVHLSSKTNSRVTLREVKSGIIHPRERLSCSSNKARKVKIGSKWDVTEVTYVYPEKQTYFTRLEGTKSICTRSN